MDKPRIVVNTKLTRYCLLSFASIRIDKIQINACIQDFECLTLIGHVLLSNRQARAQSSNTGGRKTALIKITYIIEACKPEAYLKTIRPTASRDFELIDPAALYILPGYNF